VGRASVLALIAAAAVLLVAGCGNKRQPAPVVTTTSQPFGFLPQSIPAAGLTFQRPRQWQYVPGKAPLLATMTSGLTTIAVWRYPRTEPLPTTDAELNTARDALVAAAKARDASFHVIKAKGTRAAHHPAVVIIATETVSGQPREVRSTHVYGEGGEVVFDAFAPRNVYPQVEDTVFRAVVRSLHLSKPQG
jgi:hypothetical protein